MVITQYRANRKPSGGRYIPSRSKRQQEIGRKAALTKIDEKRTKSIRTKGGGRKTTTLRTDTVNLYDPKTKKYSQAKIKTVVDSKANRHFIRRNIITKGAVVETDQGKAKITSRPGQEGAVNAILVQE